MPYPDSEYPSILRGRDKRESQRLMAAAPELLAACRMLRACLADWCEIAEDDDQRDDDHQAMRDAQAAIAKAEGRE
jgi:hypothetical protein